jgi:hypothetical protein
VSGRAQDTQTDPRWYWRGKGNSDFGLAPAAKSDAAPTVDRSRITGLGPIAQGAPGILDRIRQALSGSS